MNYFIIGDIHGCVHTLDTLLINWNPEQEILIAVGDLIDRGNYSPEVVKRCMELSNKPTACIFLQGNHELEMLTHIESGYNPYWIKQGGEETLRQFEQAQTDMEKTIQWIQECPILFQTPNLLITHAGLSDTDQPFDKQNMDGVLWNRNPLKNTGQLQVHGHTPLKQSGPIYTKQSHSWNIDTGCVYGNGLTAIVVDDQGQFIKKYFIATDLRDIQ